MRIAYLVPEALALASGVSEKVAAQCRCWRDAGHTVALFSFQRDGSGTALPTTTDVVRPADDVFLQPWATRSSPGAEWQRQVGLARLALAIRRWRPSVLYLRFGRYAVGLGRAFAAAPMVVEVNSDDLAEYAFRPVALRAWNRATRRVIFSAAAGIVAPTNELALRTSFTRFGRPTVVIPNGVDLSLFEASAPPDHDRPVAVFAASGASPWHGTDKVLRLAQRLPGIDFEVIGPYEAATASPNVTWQGVLSPAAVRARLRRADIGIGTLALHRKRMEEACPLKVREYLASGLPTIVAYHDTDFPDGADFLLPLPNTERNVEEGDEAVAEFVTAHAGRRVPRSFIAHLDQRVKEELRLQFLERAFRNAR